MLPQTQDSPLLQQPQVQRVCHLAGRVEVTCPVLSFQTSVSGFVAADLLDADDVSGGLDHAQRHPTVLQHLKQVTTELKQRCN